MQDNLSRGTMVEHPLYGKGIIANATFATYEIYFERKGKLEFSKDTSDIEVLDPVVDIKPQPQMTYTDVKKMLYTVLEKYNGLESRFELGEKWVNGTLVIKAGSSEIKPKEIPIDTFFHKIVMMRDKLRVLEQNINSHPKLSDEEKVNLQQYITRVYGSMTTFNFLFANKEDYFVGAKGSE